MNAKEFETELIDFERKQYKKFQKYQDIAFNTLVQFDRVCRKNHIPYYLAYGTLLGAVRDQGILPWDYDVDVFISYEDKDRIISALNKDLSKDYYFCCAETDVKCRHYFIRVCENGYDSSAMHVDVFFLIGAPDSEAAFRKKSVLIEKVCKARYAKLVNAKIESMGRKMSYLRLLLYKIKHRFSPIVALNRKYTVLCKADLHGTGYLMTADSFAVEKRYKREWFARTIEIKTRGESFFAPAAYDEILCATYGDYMRYPSILSRATEYRNHLNRLEYFTHLKGEK